MTATFTNAAALTEQGISVFPCLATKAPACPTGFHAATCDPKELGDLFRRHPGPLIGVPTGEPNGFDVFDLDLPKHAEAAAWWESNRPRIPETRTHATRSGGLHLLFQHQPGLRCSAGKIALGVDVRASGGYIIWWPGAGLPIVCEMPIVPWPDWLARKLLPPARPASPSETQAHYGSIPALGGLIRTIANAPVGQRNCCLFWAACRMGDRIQAGRMTQPYATAILQEAARLAGLPALEAAQTISSGLSAMKRETRHG